MPCSENYKRITECITSWINWTDFRSIYDLFISFHYRQWFILGFFKDLDNSWSYSAFKFEFKSMGVAHCTKNKDLFQWKPILKRWKNTESIKFDKENTVHSAISM